TAWSRRGNAAEPVDVRDRGYRPRIRRWPDRAARGVDRVAPRCHAADRVCASARTGQGMMAMFQPPDPAEPTPLTEVPGRTGIVGGATRIPRPLTPLIARDVEVAQIASLLHDPGVRLLTLTGPGGVGKTRLAIAAATAAADRFPDGQAF